MKKPGRLQQILSNKLYLLLALLALANLAGTGFDEGSWRTVLSLADCSRPKSSQMLISPTTDVSLFPGQPVRLMAKVESRVLDNDWFDSGIAPWFTVQITPRGSRTADVVISPTDKLTPDVEGRQRTVTIETDHDEVPLSQGRVIVTASGLPSFGYDSNPLVMKSESTQLTRVFIVTPGPDSWTLEIESMSSGLTIENPQPDVSTSSFTFTVKSGTQSGWIKIKASAGPFILGPATLWVQVPGA